MIGRPTTAQLLEDCARELRDKVLPAVTDDTLRVDLQMLEQVVRSCALRAAHEIAWMAEEVVAIEAYAADAVLALPDAEEAAAALAAFREQRPDTLHLDDRVADYDRAGEALATAVEAALAAGDAELTAQGTALLGERRDREADLRPDFTFPGRS